MGTPSTELPAIDENVRLVQFKAKRRPVTEHRREWMREYMRNRRLNERLQAPVTVDNGRRLQNTG